MAPPQDKIPDAKVISTENVHSAQTDTVLRQPWKEVLGENIQNEEDKKAELVKATVIVEEAYNPTLSG